MEDNQLDRPRYYRRMIVDHRYWDYLLNLPEGFKVEGMMESSEYGGYQFLIGCPEEGEYQVGLNEPILLVLAHTKELGDGTHVVFYPDLGQEEPPDQPNLREIAFNMAEILRQILQDDGGVPMFLISATLKEYDNA